MKNKTVKILIVDDHPAVRTTMIDVLNEEGFQTDHAKDGEMGLTKCMVNSYDFVLIDVQMPKMNGVEVLRKLKHEKETLPQFIFFTAYSLPELKDEALELGCLAFLQKPIRIEKVIALIKDFKSIPVLVCLKNSDQSGKVTDKLQGHGFHTITTSSVDEALIQLRQINYKFLIFDTDWPGSEQESIQTTIKSLHSNTICIETNEDEATDLSIAKIKEYTQKEKLASAE
ncbi:MAG: response regulator [Opitutales bacterium]|nr:response regulator [Opitutales bacterium]